MNKNQSQQQQQHQPPQHHSNPADPQRLDINKVFQCLHKNLNQQQHQPPQHHSNPADPPLVLAEIFQVLGECAPQMVRNPKIAEYVLQYVSMIRKELLEEQEKEKKEDENHTLLLNVKVEKRDFVTEITRLCSDLQDKTEAEKVKNYASLLHVLVDMGMDPRQAHEEITRYINPPVGGGSGGEPFQEK